MSIYKNNQLVAGGRQCMPLLSFMWADHQLNDISWLRADTFSWQDGGVYEAAYQHLADDYSDAPYLTLKTRYDHDGQSDYIMYYRDPSNDITSPGGALPVLTPLYAWTSSNAGAEHTTVYSEGIDTFPALLYYISGSILGHVSNTTPLEWYKHKPETVAGISINCCQTADGHKIVLADQESAVAAIYTATGVAWYYILDTTNHRFKLPRSKHNKYNDKNIPVFGNGEVLGLTDGNGGHRVIGAYVWNSGYRNGMGLAGSVTNRVMPTSASDDRTNFGPLGVDPDYTKSGLVAQAQSQETDQYKYLYFYVGNFTQTALENTAGLNAELFNGKVDTGHQVIAFQQPTAQNNYTWYRKYADGWVEQGGKKPTTAVWSTITLPVPMADANYVVVTTTQHKNSTSQFSSQVDSQTTVGFDTLQDFPTCWYVCGMAAN